MVLNFIVRGDYMVSIDLKDAYFSVPIFFPLPGNICGSFEETDQRYEFTCLPFGYSLAPRFLQ